jgi:prepilin-type N-terminal cleavage/methylation domain-containing protein
MFKQKSKNSFTLVELMIVLAILSTLSGIILFTVKPGVILDEFNDQKRLTEIKAISKSIDYLNTVAMGNLNLGTATTIYLSLPDNTSTTCSSYALATLPTGYSYACKNSTDYRKNDSNG